MNQHLRRSVRPLLLALFVSGSVFAAQSNQAAIEQAAALEDKADFPAIVKLLQPSAKTGNVDIEQILANALFNVAINGRRSEELKPGEMQVAIDMAEQAATHDSARALNLLYMTYANGYGITPDTSKAMHYLHRAAAAGDDGAKLNFAIMLYSGSESVEWDDSGKYF